MHLQAQLTILCHFDTELLKIMQFVQFVQFVAGV
jgi:hypothetical protein